MPGWFEIRLNANSETMGAVTNFLFELGCAGCEENGNEIVAYFAASLDRKKTEFQLQRFLADLEQMALLVTNAPISKEIPDQDWNAEWKKHFKPTVISQRFTVKPTWEPLARPRTEFVLEIDPKQAFGTGSHATTALMLQCIEKVTVAGKSVLDVGTGTGILAIAARMLGAESVAAFDNDPVAIEAAEENVCQNLGAEHGITLLVAEPDQVTLPERAYDLVLANLTKNVILCYLDQFSGFMADSARLILSGILIEELLALKQSLATHGVFAIKQEAHREEWAALVLQKRA